MVDDRRLADEVARATADHRAARERLTTRPGPPGAGRRRELADLTDGWLTTLFRLSGAGALGAALVAVGGHGRRELAPGSDLDLVLLHPAGVDAAEAARAADRLWYPVWDAGVPLDHAVRRVDEAVRVAREDVKAAVGMLDVRLVAGDPALADELRRRVLEQWRQDGRAHVTALRAAAEERAASHGELAHLLEPDLKESHGGLRDVTTLRAVAATWVADSGSPAVTSAATTLLDVRDALHVASGRVGAGRRGPDRLVMEEHGRVATQLGVDEDELLRSVSGAGRTVAHALDLLWQRVDRDRRPAGRALRGPAALVRRRVRRGAAPVRTPLADGVVEQDGQAVLARDARPGDDPVLVLRAAAAAAQAGLRLSPATVQRLALECPPLPRPWPGAARDALVSLLGAGPAAVPVWEDLDQAGVVESLLPEWGPLRSKPQRNPVHRFTVDRHLVETAVQAAALTRRVQRPDLLLLGALLHDVGKGEPVDHTDNGVRVVTGLAPALGLGPDDAATLVALVRHHLLLPDTATRRDLDDPRTVQTVVDAVGTAEMLELLAALTEADALATGPAAWTPWRAGLVRELVDRARAVLSGALVRPAPGLTDEQRAFAAAAQVRVGGVDLRLEPGEGAAELTVVALEDRVGLLATVAGVLSLSRLLVRGATVGEIGGRAVSVWRVEPEFGSLPDPARLRDDLRRALSGSLDVAARLAAREEAYPPRRGVPVPHPRVLLLPDASDAATVIEVRAHDRPGLLHRIGRALEVGGADVRSAAVTTLGSEAVDTFYVTRPGGGPLPPDDARRLADRVRAALTS